MTKTKSITINALPKLNLLDAQEGWRERNEALSSFVQMYFSEKTDGINILEAGCGRKWHLNLGDISYKLTGIDINKKALELRKVNEGDLDRSIVGDLVVYDVLCNSIVTDTGFMRHVWRFKAIYCTDEIVVDFDAIKDLIKKVEK